MEQERTEKKALWHFTCHHKLDKMKKAQKKVISESRNTVDNLESDSNYPAISWYEQRRCHDVIKEMNSEISADADDCKRDERWLSCDYEAGYNRCW